MLPIGSNPNHKQRADLRKYPYIANAIFCAGSFVTLWQN